MSTNEAKTAQKPGGAASDPRRDLSGRRDPRVRIYRISIIVLLLALAAGLTYGLAARSGNGKTNPLGASVPVARGNLTVSVTEGGQLIAMESLEMKSQVEGQKSILEVVDEGYVVTQADVDAGKALVRLDSSDLEQQASSRQISFYNAESQRTQAQEAYAMKQKENESNISIAELNLKFARLELERHLGAELAARVLEAKMDFAALGDVKDLGGMAEQSVRDLDSSVQLATEEISRAQEKLDWSKKLFEKGYVSRNDLTADELAMTRCTIELKAAQENLALLKRYTLPKEAEQRYSDCVEKARELDRVQAKARSELAQKEADVRARQASYDQEKTRLDKTQLMVQNCIIRAPKPGRVVYGSTASGNPWERRNSPIRAGSNVRQNQLILTIPNLSTLAAQVNVHETDVQKVHIGQRALITVEAMPGKTFPGKVKTMSPVASSADAWLNPGIKVYTTNIALDEVPEGLTPGMSATAQVIVAELRDVLSVPISAVTTYQGKRVCLAETPSGPAVRTIETGYFTDKAVEIKSGLNEGEKVYLEPAQQLGEQFWELKPEITAADLPLVKEATERAAAAGKPAAQGVPPALGAPAAPEGPAPAPAPASPAAAPEGAPKAPGAQPQPAQPAQEAQAQPDWRTFGQQLRNATTDEERQKVMQKMMEQMTPEQRKQFEDRMKQFQSMTPEEREQRRQQGGGGGGQGTWGGGQG